MERKQRKQRKLFSYCDKLKKEELASKRANSLRSLYRGDPCMSNRKKYVKSLEDLKLLVIDSLKY